MVLVMEVFRELITCIQHVPRKESLRHKLEFAHPFVFATRWRKPLYNFLSNRIPSLKSVRSATLGCKDII